MVGERIRKLRRAKDWTQKELGERVGIDQKNISQYESGRLQPNRKTLQRFAHAFDIRPEELLAEEPADPIIAIDDAELLSIFREVSKLQEADRNRLKWMLSLAVRQLRIQDVMQAS